MSSITEDASSEASSETDENHFQASAATRIQAVRLSVSTMFESIGKQILKSRDAQKYFGVDANLSWQIFKLLGPGDSFGVAQYIPSAVSMQRIFSAALSKGVAPSLIEASGVAFEAFEAFVAIYAGDRIRFDSMASAVSQGEDAIQADIQHRKALFRSHCHYWGLEVDTMYIANIVGPSPIDKEACDSVFISNMLDLRRLRPDADTHVMGIHFQNPAVKMPARDPLDPEARKIHGVSVLPSFSTKALPLMRTKVDQWGRVQARLAGSAVGLPSSVDLAFAEVMHGVLNAFGNNPFDIVGRLVIGRPTRRVYMDILVDRKLFPNLSSSVKLYGHASIAVPPQDHEKENWSLLCREQVAYFRPQDDARLAEVPRRRELLTYACARQGWLLENFDLYRLHVEYPILDTVIVVKLTRPECPTPYSLDI